jgi:hypothetical protein
LKSLATTSPVSLAGKRGFFVASLANAESRENAIEDIVGIDFTGDLADGVQCSSKFHGNQFFSQAIGDQLPGTGDTLFCLPNGLLAATGRQASGVAGESDLTDSLFNTVL